ASFCRISFRFVERLLGDDSRRAFAGFGPAGALARGKEGASRLYAGSEAPQSGAGRHVDVDRFHAALPEVGFVPETRALRIPKEGLPPLAMGIRACPRLETFEI